MLQSMMIYEYLILSRIRKDKNGNLKIGKIQT
jgi:hypothetical protein